MEASTVTLKGQIVIPVTIRRKLGLKKGSRVVFVETKEGYIVKPLDKAYFDALAGILPGSKATKALLAERQKERKHENTRSR